jgi:D-beta-D-heptose 7-phosphate kinase/D-beta-D-heptose 1-phosphate adenosyltransferase
MDIDISKFKECKIFVIGDLMVDEYLWGDVDRISPEAPVPVIAVKKEESTLGGSGNVINNLIALGAKVFAAGVIGSDRSGNILIKKFSSLGLDVQGIIQEPGRPTTRKTRIIAGNQHVLRIDRETTKTVSDDTSNKIVNFIEKKIPEADVVLISDYGKGLISKALVSKIVKLSKKYGKKTIADPKGLDYTKYSGVDLITPNMKEAALASGIEIKNNSSVLKAGEKIIESSAVANVLITCGKDGMVLFEKGKRPYKIKAKARQVFDVSGAGDTVVAMLGLCTAYGTTLKAGASIANTAAGIVVGKIGTATVSEDELSDALSVCSYDYRTKQKSLPQLRALLKDLKNKGKRIVLTNGCFDLLHTGHIKLFSDSKKEGDILIVAIDDDDSVKKLKGNRRPVIKAKERVRILSALDSVDYIIVFPANKLGSLLEAVRPDVLTKGSNYSSEEVFGRDIVENYGGRVVIIPIREKISATSIIESIRKNDSVL